MGTWGTGIKDNDTSSDIYDDFYDKYNSGETPQNISKELISDNKSLIKNPDDCNNFWFALALAQWETKSLQPDVYEKVKSIIDSKIDLQIWKELDSVEQDIKKREIVLNKFLEKIQKEKTKAKARQKPEKIIAVPPFLKGDCLAFKLDNGNYGGAVVLEVHKDKKYGGQNLIASTRINQKELPNQKDFIDTDVLLASYLNNERKHSLIWYHANEFNEYKSSFELTGKVVVNKRYKYGGVGTVTSGWGNIKYCTDRQFDFEKENPIPSNKLKMSELVKPSGKWWKFW